MGVIGTNALLSALAAEREKAAKAETAAIEQQSIITDLREQSIAEESLLSEQQKAIAKKRSDVLGKQSLITSQQELQVEKEKTKTILEQLLAAAEEEQDFAEVSRLKAEIAENERESQELEASLLQDTKALELEKIELKKLEDSLVEQELEHKQTNFALNQAELEYDKNKIQSMGGVLNLMSALVPIMTTIQNLQQAGFLLDKLINKEKRKQLLLELEKQKAESKGIKKALLGAAINMAKSAASIPVAGWVIAIAILAAVGIGIAVAVTKAQALTNSVEDTQEALNQLQADLYNLNQSITTVNKLGDEFETLSSKIIKTSEDLERMNEIAQQVNDTLGYQAVNLNADAATQALQIKGAEAQLRKEKDELIQESAKVLVNRYDIVNQAKGYNKTEYIASLGEAGKNTIRNIAITQLDGLAEQNAETQSIIQDIFLQQAATMMDTANDKFDTAMFESLFKEQQTGQTFQSFMQGLNKAASDGSLSAYSTWLNSLSKQTRNLVIESNEYLDSIFALSDTGLINTLDDLNFTNEDVNELYSLAELQASMTEAKDTASDIFRQMADNEIQTTQEMYASMISSGDEWLKHIKELNGDYNQDADYRLLQDKKRAKEEDILAQEAVVKKAEKEHGEKSEEYIEAQQTLNELRGEYENLADQERK